MIKYSIEDLKNLTDEELSEISKAISDKKIKFSDKEMQIIYDKIDKYTKVYECMKEFYQSAKLINHEVFSEQEDALKKAYIAHEKDDWTKCKKALEIFFEWTGEEEILLFDLSFWSFQHIMKWFNMLVNTELSNSPTGSPARIVSRKINEQVVQRMPEHLQSKLWDKLREIYPDLVALFENSKTITEDGKPCVDISEVARHLEISEEEILHLFEGADPGKYMVTKDKVYTLQ